tara:strand:+ start:284 stop:550 length:267 start_codon:yes stop_codon:yes gene_type:complete
MYKFKQFMMNAQKQKRCPDGYRFDKALRVCVPIGITRYNPYFGGRGNNDQQTDTSNGNGQNGNGNGNGGNGNGTNSGNGNNTSGGNGQ